MMIDIAAPNTILAFLNHLKDDHLYQEQCPYEVWLDEKTPGLPKATSIDPRLLGSYGRLSLQAIWR
jgi:hypothetical protein